MKETREKIEEEFEDVLNFSKEIWNGWCNATKEERDNVKSFLFSIVDSLLAQQREELKKMIDDRLKVLAQTSEPEKAERILGWERNKEILFGEARGLNFIKKSLSPKQDLTQDK